MTKQSRTVYPVEGVFLVDVPHIEHDCDDDRCVDSGAFTTKRPRDTAKQTEAPQEAGPSGPTSKE